MRWRHTWTIANTEANPSRFALPAASSASSIHERMHPLSHTEGGRLFPMGSVGVEGGKSRYQLRTR